MAASIRETRRYDGCETYANLNGFARVVVFEQPVEVRNRDEVVGRYQFLFVEALHNHGWTDVSLLKPTDEAKEQGWRIYYQQEDLYRTVQKTERESQLRELVQSNRWFALRAKGPDAVGVYFPAELRENDTSMTELLKAVDAYFRSTGALVEVPQELNIREAHMNPHVNPEGVANPWTGLPECCVDFVFHGRGAARVNEISIDRDDSIYQPVQAPQPTIILP